MSKVYISQMLCPQRHCVIGLAFEAAHQGQEQIDYLTEQTRKYFDAAVADKLQNPWCGICGSRELHVETAPTKYATMTEAEPVLKELQEANARTRAALSHEMNRN